MVKNRTLLRVFVSGAVTLATAPLVRRTMIAHGVLDHPNHRSSHSEPIPRGGGVACALGITTALLIKPHPVSARYAVAVATITAAGFADDQLGGISPVVRLATQSFAGLICGLPSPTRTGASVILLPAVVNVVNFMDGINGISASTAVVWGTLAAFDSKAPSAVQALAAATAGAGLGFLPHNAPHADLFLGDVGSYLFGSLMGVSIIATLGQPTLTARIAAPLLPYAADASWTLHRRWRSGQSLTQAHREHVYQRLVDEFALTHAHVASLHAAVATFNGLAWRTLGPVKATLFSGALVTSYVALPSVLQGAKGRRSR